jgi:hypothetical protein
VAYVFDSELLALNLYSTIVIDVAGQYAGSIQSMTQLARSATFFLNPLLVTLLIPNHVCIQSAPRMGPTCEAGSKLDVSERVPIQVNSTSTSRRKSNSSLYLIRELLFSQSQLEWNTYFLVISFLTMYGVIVFVIFGSGDLQPWARVVPEKSANKNCQKKVVESQ